MPFYFMDYWYLILVLPAVLLSLVAQVRVQSTFSKYSKLGTGSGMTGRQASEEIQRRNGIRVPLEQVSGSMTDHYDPKSNVIRLSETVGEVRSIAAIGVAAHETGHALQYAEEYGPVKIRTLIYPATRFAATFSPYLVLAGLLFSFPILAYAGVAFFALSTIFQLLTLPVEFNASARAMKALREGGILTEEELKGVRKVLTAAAMTYVAALFMSLMSLLRLLILVMGRGRRND
ncbi:MAG: zinc metallopeptidase [Clostridiales bacterium]|nr:zinc metallopeptidase [Clostridiales bacterium]